jgi:hypothetical protein
MRQTNVAFAFCVCFFKVFSKSYIAHFRCSFSLRFIALLSGLKVCHTFCNLHELRHVSLLHCSKPLHSLRSISPAALGFISLRSFQSLLTMPAAHNFARLLVALGCGAVTVFVRKTKTPPGPCVYNIGRTRALVGTPVLPPKAPLAGRLAKAAQVSAIHSVALHSLQPLLPPHSRRRYNLSN